MEHDQTVTKGDGMIHIMCNHQGRQPLPFDNFLREQKNLVGCLWIKGCDVLI